MKSPLIREYVYLNRDGLHINSNIAYALAMTNDMEFTKKQFKKKPLMIGKIKNCPVFLNYQLTEYPIDKANGVYYYSKLKNISKRVLKFVNDYSFFYFGRYNPKPKNTGRAKNHR